MVMVGLEKSKQNDGKQRNVGEFQVQKYVIWMLIGIFLGKMQMFW